MDEKMKRWIVYIFITVAAAMAMVSCSADFHMNKSRKHATKACIKDPELCSNNIDTNFVTIKKFADSTIYNYKDTLVLKFRDSTVVNTVFHTKDLFVSGNDTIDCAECLENCIDSISQSVSKTDTVLVIKEVPVYEVNEKQSFFEKTADVFKHVLAAAILILVLLIIYRLIGRRRA